MDLLDGLHSHHSYERLTDPSDLLEDDGSMDAWYARIRNPRHFQKGIRVKTSPKRLEDPIETGVCTADAFNDGGDWKVPVRWDHHTAPINPSTGSRYRGDLDIVARLNPGGYSSGGYSSGGYIAEAVSPRPIDLRSLYPLETY